MSTPSVVAVPTSSPPPDMGQGYLPGFAMLQLAISPQAKEALIVTLAVGLHALLSSGNTIFPGWFVRVHFLRLPIFQLSRFINDAQSALTNDIHVRYVTGGMAHVNWLGFSSSSRTTHAAACCIDIY